MFYHPTEGAKMTVAFVDNKMSNRLPPIRIGNTGFNWGERTYVMGICNLSADSFSGDGIGNDVEAAVAQAKRFVEEGADIIDVGGESTRPGTEPLDAGNVDKEIELVIPVIQRLAGEIPVPISVDTYKSSVARRAVEAGAGAEAALFIAALSSGDVGTGADLATLLKNFLVGDEGRGIEALKALIEISGPDMKLRARPGQVRIPSKGVNL